MGLDLEAHFVRTAFLIHFILKILRSIIHRYSRYREAFLRRYHRQRALWQARLHAGTLVWPATAAATVPVRIDGKGHVEIGEAVTLGYGPAPRVGKGEILLQARAASGRIVIGCRTATSNNISIVSMQSVVLGEGCQIGDLVSIRDCDFHEINPATRNSSPGEISPVVIGRNVWLGSRVMVLKGVTIGDNTVVAAGAVVTKSLPANVVAAGVPAKVVREIRPTDI